MRFDEMIRAGMIVRDVKVQYPKTVPVFESHGFRGSCDDCSVDQVCRKYGLDPRDIVDELNRAIAGQSA